MKKLIAVLGGLLHGNVALACNMDRDNCADVMLPELKSDLEMQDLRNCN